MKKFGHKAIRASAGSGKTFQLAHRFIGLLARGVQPERIIALTFSRKAAGEIFDSIVTYLCEASASAEQAKKTTALIGEPHLGPAEFLGLLRTVLQGLHRLHIGTLDSFTIGVVRTFPMELGVAPEFEVMDNDGDSARRAREDVLLDIFRPRGGADPAARAAFRDAFKQATFGQEEKDLARNLNEFFDAYQKVYRVLPSGEAWGNESLTWPGDSPWLDGSYLEGDDVGAVAGRLQAALEADNLSDAVMQRWDTFVKAVQGFEAGSPWTRDIEYLFEKLAQTMPALGNEDVSLKVGRTAVNLSGREGGQARALLAHVVSTELNTALQRTRGLYRLIDGYEKLYDEKVRRHGRLTFDDAQYLLTGANRHSGGALLSREPAAEARLYIDFRLDSKLDHWLLDEFQDTSDLQWEALRNLADEVLQDDSGERSFFYVGDVKQAIYGWRGGNAGLFGKILDHYGERIEVTPLDTSYRSCDCITETLNRVFGELPDEGLPAATVEEWHRLWHEHRSEKGKVPERGYVALLEPPSENGTVKPDEASRYVAVARLLTEMDPLERGLSVAVLVRTNAHGRALVDVLRSECPGISVAHEGAATIADNPVVALLLSLVKFAAHPGDLLAWRHLQMSPLQACFAKDRLNRNNLPLLLLRRIQRDGFQAFIRYWGARLQSAKPLDAFGTKRLRDLLEAAEAFDDGGLRDGNAFLRAMERHTLHELASDEAVRVMTVHQSKGLGFDVVILPDLQGEGMSSAGEVNMVVARHPETNRPLWTLRMPRRSVAEQDAVLVEQVEDADRSAAFDDLCVLYVALTRAKRGLYMITGYPGKSAASFTAAALLKTQLCDDPKPTDGPRMVVGGEEYVRLFEAGIADWYEEFPARSKDPVSPPEHALSERFKKGDSRRKRLQRVTPSGQADEPEPAALLFAPQLGASFAFGSEVHALFEKVEWLDACNPAEAVACWRAESPADAVVQEEVLKQFHDVVNAPEAGRALHRPAQPAELWREQSFEVVLGDEWVTGTFDRVVIEKDEKGQPTAATILDFKSNDVSTPEEIQRTAEHYRPQLELYARALSRMLGLEREAISLQLLFTRPAQWVEL